MYSRFLLFAATTLWCVFSGCSTYTAAAPGISPDEERALTSDYYWRAGTRPRSYTSAQLDTLLRASVDPTLDGEYAEAQASRVAVALTSVGDRRFSEAILRQSDTVKQAVAREVMYLWTRHKLDYPLTVRALRPYI